jgi:hypothetical protein
MALGLRFIRVVPAFCWVRLACLAVGPRDNRPPGGVRGGRGTRVRTGRRRARIVTCAALPDSDLCEWPHGVSSIYFCCYKKKGRGSARAHKKRRGGGGGGGAYEFHYRGSMHVRRAPHVAPGFHRGTGGAREQERPSISQRLRRFGASAPAGAGRRALSRQGAWCAGSARWWRAESRGNQTQGAFKAGRVVRGQCAVVESREPREPDAVQPHALGWEMQGMGSSAASSGPLALCLTAPTRAPACRRGCGAPGFGESPSPGPARFRYKLGGLFGVSSISD